MTSEQRDTTDWLLSGARSKGPGNSLIIVGVTSTMMALGPFALMLLLQVVDIPDTGISDSADPVWYDILKTGVLAPVSEELLVVALPLMILRREAPRWLKGRRLVVVVTVLVAARMAYHLYQGVYSLTHLPWALATVLLYITYRAVWPIIIAHAGYNSALILHDHGQLTEQGLYIAMLLAPVVIIAAGMVRRHRAARHPREPQSTLS